jgi:hypothetical protein
MNTPSSSVQFPQHRFGISGIVQGRRTQGVAGQRGQRRRVGTLSAHVTQEERPPPGPQGEDVVKVSSDISRRGGVIVASQRQAWNRGQRRRQQRPLQGGREAGERGLVSFRFMPRVAGRGTARAVLRAEQRPRRHISRPPAAPARIPVAGRDEGFRPALNDPQVPNTRHLTAGLGRCRGAAPHRVPSRGGRERGGYSA